MLPTLHTSRLPKRSLLSLAAAASLAVAAQQGHAQSFTVNTSQGSVALDGQTGVVIGPNTATTINSVSLSPGGTDAAVGATAGLTNSASVNGLSITGGTLSAQNADALDNSGTIGQLALSPGVSGSTTVAGIITSANASGIVNTGTISYLVNNGSTISGATTGVTNSGTIGGGGGGNDAGLLVGVTGTNIGSVTGGQTGLLNNAGATILNGVELYLGGSITATGTGGVAINNQGAIDAVPNGIQQGVYEPGSIVVDGPVSAPASGIAILNGPAGSLPGGIYNNATIEGGTGIDNYGSLPTIQSVFGGTIIGQTTAGVVLENGTATTVSLNGLSGLPGTIEGTNAANGVDVDNAAALTLHMSNFSVLKAQTGTALDVAPGATADVTMSGAAQIEASGTNPAMRVAGSTTLGLTLSGTTAPNVANFATGSAISVAAGGNLGLTTSGTWTGTGSDPAPGIFTAANGAAALDAAGTVTANISGNFEIRNTGAGTGIAVENGGSASVTEAGGAQIEAVTGSAITVAPGGTLNLSTAGYATGSSTAISNNSPTVPTIDMAGAGTLKLGGTVANGTSNANAPALTLEASSSVPAITNTGFIGGALNNLSANNLTLNGAATYTDQNSPVPFQGIFTADRVGQSTINNTKSNLTIGSGYVILDDTVNLGSHSMTVASGAHLVSFEPVATNGNLVVATGATLISQVQSGAAATGKVTDNGYGQWKVSGNVTFQGNTSVQLAPATSYGFSSGQRFLMVTAGGTATYNVAGITSTAAGYSGPITAEQVGNDLVECLGSSCATTTPPNSPSSPSSPTGPTKPTDPTSPTQPSTPVTPADPVTREACTGASANERAAVGAILRYPGINAGLLGVYNPTVAMAANDPGECGRVGAALLPAPESALGKAMLSMSNDLLDSIDDNLDHAEAGHGLHVWGHGIGGAQQDGSYAGVDGYNFSYGGLMLGADKALNDHWRVGGAFSITGESLRGTGSSSNQTVSGQSYGFYGYARLNGTRGWIDFSQEVAQNEFSETRGVDFPGLEGQASSHFNAQTYATRVVGGLPLMLAHDITLTPLAGLTVGVFTHSGYTESGTAALNVSGSTMTSVRSNLGVRVEKPFATAAGTIVPWAQLSYLHDFVHHAPDTTASFVGDTTGATTFTTSGQAMPENLVDFGVGATVYKTKGLTLQARFDVKAGDHYTSESGLLQLNKQF